MPIPPGFAHISYVFSGQAAGPGGCMVTMGAENNTAAPPQGVAVDLFEMFGDIIMPGLSAAVTLSECRLRLAAVEGEAVFSAFGAVAGGEVSEVAPPNCAYPVTKFSTLAGRANRGRWFLPGVTNGHIGADGSIDSGIIDGFNDSLGDYLAAMTALDLPPVILHTSVSDPTPIVALIMGNLIFSRGSRLR